jgi:hypothetical protein
MSLPNAKVHSGVAAKLPNNRQIRILTIDSGPSAFWETKTCLKFAGQTGLYHLLYRKLLLRAHGASGHYFVGRMKRLTACEHYKRNKQFTRSRLFRPVRCVIGLSRGMPRKAVRRSTMSHRWIVLLALASQAWSLAPQRLLLKVENRTLAVGDTTQLTLGFQDYRYNPVPNDRRRIIDIFVRAMAQRAPSGQVLPGRIKVSPGQQMYPGIKFRALAPGKVTIVAASEGLEEAQALVVIVQGKPRASLRFRSFNSIVNAQSNPAIEILPEGIQNVAANGTTRATLYVTFTQPVKQGEQIRIATQPGSTILYGGTQHFGVAQITMNNGVAITEEIYFASSQVGKVRVSAQLLSSGVKAERDIRFEPPQPHRVMLTPQHGTIPSDERSVSLTVGIQDRGGVPISVLTKKHQVKLTPKTDLEIYRFDPMTIALTPDHASRSSLVELSAIPSGGSIKVRGNDEDGDLEPGETTVAIDTPVRKILASGPAKVSTGQEFNITLTLANQEGKACSADWDRDITITSDSAEIETTARRIGKGHRQIQVKMRAPRSTGFYNIKADNAEIDGASWTVRVVTAAFTLILWALGGGLIGGMIRNTYNAHKAGTTTILPVWSETQRKAGLLGNMGVGAVVAFVVFEFIELGLVPSMAGVTQTLGAETWPFAAAIGILAGFGGVVLLEWLISIIFPGYDKPEKKVQTAHS